MSSSLTIVHLLASPSLGGPERQLLGIAQNLPRPCRTVFLTFAERGLSRPFVDETKRLGFEVHSLRANTPNFLQATREIAGHLRRCQAAVLCASGYKADILGWAAARALRLPIVSISHGWTGANWRARVYEGLDRRMLRAMDKIVCVSQAQAAKVRGSGAPDDKVLVVSNAIDPDPPLKPRSLVEREVRGGFPEGCRFVVGAAGRLSPEKGFRVFVRAAALVAEKRDDVGFALFGDGPEAPWIERESAPLGTRFRWLGFRADLVDCLGALDLLVMPSFTEGLPVLSLEAGAAGLPIVASAVGGIPEVVVDEKTGFLTPPGDARALADKILHALADPERLRQMGARARARIRGRFHVREQAARYHQVFRSLAQATER